MCLGRRLNSEKPLVHSIVKGHSLSISFEGDYFLNRGYPHSPGASPVAFYKVNALVVY